MSPNSFVATTIVPASAEAVFAWHEAPGALERLTPPWGGVTVLSRDGGIRNGARVSLRVRLGPLPLRWDFEHVDYQPGRSFTDRQVRGPFRSWRHVHRMIPRGGHECLLEDSIEYELPFGGLGRLFEPMIQRRLARLLAFRHEMTRRAFEHA
jgi:uncharacterized protein